MTYALLEDEVIKQLAESAVAFDRHASAAQTLQSRYPAKMNWQERGGVLQLIKTQSDGREHSLGDQTDERVALYNKYVAEQLAANQMLELSTKDLQVARGRNVSMGTARVPTIVIQILNELDNKGLGGYYRVIGTHALYAYEVAAGVAFDAESTTTRDVDLLWDVQQRIRLVANLDAAGLTMLQLLQLVDTSFERMEDQKESAVNAEGFAVDFLRRRGPDDKVADSISGKEGDVLPVPAENAQEFLNSKAYEQVVIGGDGSMARMRTVDPGIFVDFKRWLAQLDTREQIKRRRDQRQADAVEQLLCEGRLVSSVRPRSQGAWRLG
ncbi:MAG: GSU2403 family nucleotidyltransferase fold protein [Pseudomonadota bacterium]